MKIRNEVLKQLRIWARYTVAELSTKIGLSESYFLRLEAGEIENVEYIYKRYADALRIPLNKMKKLINDAERGNWDKDKIASEVKIRMEEY